MREARAFTGASSALLLGGGDGSDELTVAAADPLVERRTIEVDGLPGIRDALDDQIPTRIGGADAARLAAAAGLTGSATNVLLLPARPPAGSHRYLLMLTDGRGGGFGPEAIEAGTAFASAASATLGQVSLLERNAAQAARQSALARAAKALNESLDLSRVLPRICEEASGILGADMAGVYRGSAAAGLVLEATTASPELVGTRIEAGVGIAGRAIAVGRPVMSSELGSRPDVSSAAGGSPARSALAAPMRWDGELRGVLYVGWRGEHDLTHDDLALLDSFAELAAIACRNASVHAGLAEAAQKDGLTGCLNHAAFHDTLRREMQRSRRTGRRLSIVIVDLDHFKQVNEERGHLVGDEVLRRVGRALREAVRPYDFVARYGGDEFVIVAVDAREARAAEMAERAIGRVGRALTEVLGPSDSSIATAGVSEWDGGSSPSDLVRDADRALLYGKQQGVRGAAVPGSSVPETFALGRGRDDEAPREPAVAEASWPSAVRRETEPLRRRARQLALVSEFGARVAGMTRVVDIAEAAVAALANAFDLSVCAVVRGHPDGALETVAASGEPGPVRASAAVERCLAEGRAAFDVDAAPSLLGVPIRSGDEQWGALDLRRPARGAFGDADARFVEIVTGQLGSALRSATLYERLERAYLATSEALADAIEAKESHGSDHARVIADTAETLGRALGMGPDELRALRFAAVFHDIGKIAVPEAILNKSGPLTDAERMAVERHTVVADEMLAPVEFLARVRPLVRHSHERWDGRGYPDGLAGERIPTGARVLTVCDAHQAMLSDRPYRRALSEDAARSELAQAAGTQFDARVVEAFLALARRAAAAGTR